MRILHIAAGDLWAGAEVQLYHLAVALAQSDDVSLQVVLFNYGQLEQQLKSKGVEVIVLDESCLSGFAILSRLYRIAAEFRPDIMHTHRTKENVIGGVVAKLRGCKCIRTVHGASEFAGAGFSLRRSVFAAMEKIAGYFLQHKIIAVSDELKQKLMREYPQHKVEMIHNGIDPDYVLNKADEKTDYPFVDSDLNVVFVGRFVPVKRVDLFYEIARATIALNNRIHFYMIGDGPLQADIEQRVSNDDMASNIHLVGFVNNPLPYMQRMHLLMFSSDHEGLPMTLLEAMCLKLPVISRKLATIEHVLCDGECGYITVSDKAQDIAQMINSIASNMDDARSRAAQAHTNLINNYSIKHLVDVYMDLYRALLKPA